MIEITCSDLALWQIRPYHVACSHVISGGSRGVSKVSIETPFSLLTKLTVLTLQIVASLSSQLAGAQLAALGMLRNSADSALLGRG